MLSAVVSRQRSTNAFHTDTIWAQRDENEVKDYNRFAESLPQGLAALVHRFGFAGQVTKKAYYGEPKITFPGSHNAANDAIQHGNVALGIASDPQYLGDGLHEDDHQALAALLRQPLPRANPNLVLLSLDYEGHERHKDEITELGFWCLDISRVARSPPGPNFSNWLRHAEHFHMRNIRYLHYSHTLNIIGNPTAYRGRTHRVAFSRDIITNILDHEFQAWLKPLTTITFSGQPIIITDEALRVWLRPWPAPVGAGIPPAQPGVEASISGLWVRWLCRSIITEAERTWLQPLPFSPNPAAAPPAPVGAGFTTRPTLPAPPPAPVGAGTTPAQPVVQAIDAPDYAMQQQEAYLVSPNRFELSPILM